MSRAEEFSLVDVGAAVVERVQDGRILAVWNAGWGAFTLPMSRRHAWKDPAIPDSLHTEAWEDAAARAAAEWLGRTCEPVHLADLGEFQQTDRDGVWKRYRFQVFRVAVAGDAPLVPGAIAEWLTPEQFLHRRPISPTAKYLIGQLHEARLVGGPKGN
jgi:hypothetical protein